MGTQADSMVKEKLNTHMAGMQALSGGESAVASQLPQGSSGSGGSSTARLKELMEEVETLKAERAVIDSELKNTNPDMQSTFLSAAASGSLNELNISLASLGRTFGPLQHQVTDSIGKQEKIIAEVQDLYQPFIQERGGEGSSREEALKILAAAYDAFMELKGNLEEGTKFYNDLTQLLVTFQNKVTDFCFARKTEKEELLKDLSSSMASMSLDPPPAAPAHHDPSRPPRKNDPPARPPPPTVSASSAQPSSAPPAAAAAAPNPYVELLDPCPTLPNLLCPCPTSPTLQCPWVTIPTDINNLLKHRVTLSNSTTNLHSKGTLLRVTPSNLPRATPRSSHPKVTLARVRLIRLSNNLFQATQAILHSQALLASPSGGRFWREIAFNVDL